MMLLSSSRAPRCARRLAQRWLSASPVARAGASAAAAGDAAPLRYSSLVIERGSGRPVPADLTKNLAFGAVKSEHMLEVDWSAARGWQAPRIYPVAPLSLDPAASCLHYGLQAFEGMKAYLDADGKARLFRPELNMVRAAQCLYRRGAGRCWRNSLHLLCLLRRVPSTAFPPAPFACHLLLFCPQIRLAKSMRTLAMPALCVVLRSGGSAGAPFSSSRARACAHRPSRRTPPSFSAQAGSRVSRMH